MERDLVSAQFEMTQEGGVGGVLGRTRNLEFQEAEKGFIEVPAWVEHSGWGQQRGQDRGRRRIASAARGT